MQKVRGHLHSDSTPSWPTDHVARKGREMRHRRFVEAFVVGAGVADTVKRVGKAHVAWLLGIVGYYVLSGLTN